MKKKIVVSAALLAAVLVAGGLLYFTHAQPLEKAAAASAPPPAVSVVAGVVAQHDVPIYLSGVGTVIAYNTDVVRAQIQGQIISINFTEGQTVHASDLLAQNRSASLPGVDRSVHWKSRTRSGATHQRSGQSHALHYSG